MLQVLVAKQKEWKGRKVHHLYNQMCFFPFRLILVSLEREVYFLTFFLKKGNF